MSLDETYEALQHFSRTLEEADQILRGDEAELRARHESIDGIWRDEFRRSYDVAIEDLRRQFKRYNATQSQQFETFLQAKIVQLRHYLHGG